MYKTSTWPHDSPKNFFRSMRQTPCIDKLHPDTEHILTHAHHTKYLTWVVFHHHCSQNGETKHREETRMSSNQNLKSS